MASVSKTSAGSLSSQVGLRAYMKNEKYPFRTAEIVCAWRVKKAVAAGKKLFLIYGVCIEAEIQPNHRQLVTYIFRLLLDIRIKINHW